LLKEKKIYHKKLAAGRWKELSFEEQMGNIGSEVGRSFNWFKQGDKERFNRAFEMALELFDLTLEDERWQDKKIEITQTRALFCSLVNDTTLTDELEKKMDSLDKYFLRYGAIANEMRHKTTN
jgi:hypothetical protein